MCIIAVAVQAAYCAAGGCPFGDSLWQTLKASQRQTALSQAEPERMDLECFAGFIRRLAESGGAAASRKILAHIKKFTGANGRFDMASFYAVSEALGNVRCPECSAEMFRLWVKRRGAPGDELERLEDAGLYREMDSLYGMMSDAGALDVYEYVRWGQVQGVLKKYAGAAQSFCEVSVRSPNIAAVARQQLLQLLGDAEPGGRAGILQAYQDCCLASGSADTASLLRWVSSTCGQFGLYRQEVAAIAGLRAEAPVTGRRLYDVARVRFTRGLFVETIEPATLAYSALDAQQARSECAAMIYQSYSRLGMPDSAVAWFSRAQLTDAGSIAAAAALYQNAGLLGQADSCIARLGASVERDTLLFRQFLMRGRVNDARAEVMKRTAVAHWKRNGPDAALWKTRTAVYTGNLVSAIGHIDSTPLPPSWNGTHEMLGHKHAVQVFRKHPEAFELWGKLELALYAGAAQMIADTIRLQAPGGEVREMMFVKCARALIQDGQYAKCIELLSGMPPEERTPRVMFFQAEALMMEGDGGAARTILEKIMLESPGDVFSNRARMYLFVLDEKMRM